SWSWTHTLTWVNCLSIAGLLSSSVPGDVSSAWRRGLLENCCPTPCPPGSWRGGLGSVAVRRTRRLELASDERSARQAFGALRLRHGRLVSAAGDGRAPVPKPRCSRPCHARDERRGPRAGSGQHVIQRHAPRKPL